MEQLQTYSPSVVEQTEEEIIDAAKLDAKHFEPIYNRYYKRIFLFIYNRVGDKDLTADITSQVFMKALGGLKHYSHQGLPISSWLFRIAINEYTAHFRKKSTNHLVVLDEHHYHLLTEELAVDEEDRYKAALHRAIKSLKATEIQLIELRFFEGLKFREIAEIMEITETNAKVKAYRVLEKLRKKLQKNER